MVYDYSDLIGHKIVAVKNMSDQDIEAMGWQNGIEIVLDDESILTVASDDEGNDAGSLYHYAKNGALISVYS